WIVLGVLLGLQLLFVYLPFMNAWFRSAPLGLAGWLIPLGLAVVVFLILEVGKAVFRAYQRRVNPRRPSSPVMSRVRGRSR
ncbi:MAG: P-type ATPase, translocating, partial [Propionibacteriaceae bacterium]|nr:P-type ATPase, translocating [Propionibacteriaceae bacterium]